MHALCTQNNAIFLRQPTGKGDNANTTSAGFQNNISTAWNYRSSGDHIVHQQPKSRRITTVLTDSKNLIHLHKAIRTSHFGQLSVFVLLDTPNHRPVEFEGVLTNFLKSIAPDCNLFAWVVWDEAAVVKPHRRLQKTFDYLSWGTRHFPRNEPISCCPLYFNWCNRDWTLLCFWNSNKATARSTFRSWFIFFHKTFSKSQRWSVWGRDIWQWKQMTFSFPKRGFMQPGHSLEKKSETKAARVGFTKFFIEMDSRPPKTRKRLIFAPLCNNLTSLKK